MTTTDHVAFKDPQFQRLPETESEALSELFHILKLGNANIIKNNAKTDRTAYTGYPGLEELITLFHKPDNRFVKKSDEFLERLLTTYREAGKCIVGPFEWPTSWRGPYHG